MAKIAFVFPGQGSQYVGMGEDLIKNYKEDEEYFDKADIIFKNENIDFRELCFKGPEGELQKTVNSQPAILLISTILFNLLQKNNIFPDIVAGHSLGEYSALVVASSIDFEDAIKLVRKRGQFMQEGVPIGVGSMAAIISLNYDKVQEILSKVSQYGLLEIANYNSQYQTVVTGENIAINKLVEISVNEQDVNVVPLKVSAPFHSSLMVKAKENLASYIETINIQVPKIPLISNVTANYVRSEGDIKKALIDQMTSPIKWVNIIKKMYTEGIEYFLEVGPGEVLKKLIKQIIPKVNVYSVSDFDSINKTIKKIKFS